MSSEDTRAIAKLHDDAADEQEASDVAYWEELGEVNQKHMLRFAELVYARGYMQAQHDEDPVNVADPDGMVWSDHRKMLVKR